jgi:ATP-dependent Clp protease adaptor protein ClpS
MMTETVEDVKIDEKISISAQIPPKYKVIMLNDNATPQDFVTSILCLIFKHTEETAKKIMLTIHEEGSAVVGIYTYEVAEQRALEATTLSRDNGFPLQLKLEQE